MKETLKEKIELEIKAYTRALKMLRDRLNDAKTTSSWLDCIKIEIEIKITERFVKDLELLIN